MPKNLSKTEAILKAKCPQCREGDVFSAPLLHVTEFTKMNHNCPKCGVQFEIEPGFFFGAMYISYAFSVGTLLVAYFLLKYVFGDPDLMYYLISVPTVILLFLPFTFRYSRIIYLYLVGGFKYAPESVREMNK